MGATGGSITSAGGAQTFTGFNGLVFDAFSGIGAAGTPVVTGERAWIVAPDRVMTCLDLHSGRELWRSRRHQVRESIGGSSALVAVRTMRDSVVAFDALSPPGTERPFSSPT